jgi:hypothetical protein
VRVGDILCLGSIGNRLVLATKWEASEEDDVSIAAERTSRRKGQGQRKASRNFLEQSPC